MKLFSVKNRRNSKKLGRKIIVVTGLMFALFIGGTITSYAAEESVSYTWVQGVDGVLKVTDSNNNIVTNTWYKDTDGFYYYLGQDGSKQTGLIEKEGHYYYLDASGKLVVTDGVYEGVNLIINKDASSATYGEILSGVEGMLNAVSESAGGVQQQTSEKVPYQVVTNSWGDKEYWDPVAEVWVTVESNIQRADTVSALWDADAVELAKKVGENMAH